MFLARKQPDGERPGEFDFPLSRNLDAKARCSVMSYEFAEYRQSVARPAGAMALTSG